MYIFFARVIKFAGLKPDRDDVIGYRLNPSCHRETFFESTGGKKKRGGEKKGGKKKDISGVYKKPSSLLGPPIKENNPLNIFDTRSEIVFLHFLTDANFG